MVALAQLIFFKSQSQAIKPRLLLIRKFLDLTVQLYTHNTTLVNQLLLMVVNGNGGQLFPVTYHCLHVYQNSLLFFYLLVFLFLSYDPPCKVLSCSIPVSIYTLSDPQIPMFNMSTVAAIRLLVKEINSLSSSLSDLVPKGSKDDKIWSVMNTDECDTPHETFNRQFDVMFGEDCCDSDGHLCHVHQGKFGMGLIVSYLLKINWSIGFTLDLVHLKLQHLVTELKIVQYISYYIFCHLY